MIQKNYLDLDFNAHEFIEKTIFEFEKKNQIFLKQTNVIIDHDHFFNEITSEDIKQQLFDNTNMAVERGSFGVPTFFANDQIFFGKDKLVEIEEYLLTLK